MSLIEDLKKWYEGNNYPPEGEELDETYDPETKTFSDNGTETEQVSWKVVDSTARWGNSIEVVYKRADEYAAVYDVEPATENQSWGDYGDPEIVVVEPYEVTVTKYRKVK